MSESKDLESKAVSDKEEILVDAPAGAEAFATTGSHDSHHSLVGVEKESIDTNLIFGIVLGTVLIVIGLVAVAFTLTEVTSQSKQYLRMFQRRNILSLGKCGPRQQRVLHNMMW